VIESFMKFSLIVSILVLATAVRGADEVNLNLDQARQFALKHNPRITAAELQSLAAHESITEARAAYFPTITANATAVGTSQDNTRIAAGSLSNPGIFERNAEGIAISQLITDFGRTANLASSAKLRSGAEQAGLETVKEQVLLLTDTAYFEALRAASVLNVARQTLATRQTLLDQVSALASNKLKSELDVNFARVATDEARILMLQSESELNAAHARLAMLTGFNHDSVFQLRDVATNISTLPDVSKTINDALEHRPELRQLELTAQAARKLAKAERASGYPTLSAVGGAGVIPLHDSHFEDYYAAGGVNLSVPLFAGGLYSARAKEAQYKADATEELLQARREEVARDIRIASLVVNTAAERIKVAERLVSNAIETYSLAETRYSVGGASIVELSQAQLSKTLAQIEAATARYNYQIQLSNFKFQAGTIAQWIAE
jgi:outer membrane protein